MTKETGSFGKRRNKSHTLCVRDVAVAASTSRRAVASPVLTRKRPTTGVWRQSVERLQELEGWGIFAMCLAGSRPVSGKVPKLSQGTRQRLHQLKLLLWVFKGGELTLSFWLLSLFALRTWLRIIVHLISNILRLCCLLLFFIKVLNLDEISFTSAICKSLFHDLFRVRLRIKVLSYFINCVQLAIIVQLHMVIGFFWQFEKTKRKGLLLAFDQTMNTRLTVSNNLLMVWLILLQFTFRPTAQNWTLVMMI